MDREEFEGKMRELGFDPKRKPIPSTIRVGRKGSMISRIDGEDKKPLTDDTDEPPLERPVKPSKPL